MPVLRDDQRIHLDQARVAFTEQFHELAQNVAQFDLRRASQPEAEAELAGLVGLQACGRVECHGEDFLGRVVRDFLDIHAAGRRCHDRDALGLAVDDEAQIQLALDARPGFHVDVIDRQAFRTGLVGHEPGAEHRLRVLLDLSRGLRELDAAGLAASAGMHLGLDDPEAAAELGCGGFGLGRRSRDLTLGNWNAVIGEQLLRLILVQIHEGGFSAKRRAAYSP